MKGLEVFAITENGMKKVVIHSDLIGEVNEQIKNYPKGMPMTMESGEIVIVFAFFIPTEEMLNRGLIIPPREKRKNDDIKV